MRLQEWEFIQSHPVYQRPPEDSRWAFGLPGLRPRAYVPHRPPGAAMPETLTEPLRMDVVGHPSVDLHLTAAGNTVQTIRLHSKHAGGMDLSRIGQLARQMWEAYKRLSRGPYTQRDLRMMGHPYGYEHNRTAAGYVQAAWSTLRNPRKIPGFVGAYRTGPRGFVGNRAVVNSQTGEFERAWRWNMVPSGDGLLLNFWNERKSETGAPISWFLAHGTIFMQAHGPWQEVLDQMLPLIQAEWHKQAVDAARASDLDESQFGSDVLEAEAAREAASGGSGWGGMGSMLGSAWDWLKGLFGRFF